MKKALFLSFQLLAYIGAALLAGRYIDAYFSLKGKATLIAVFLVYIVWLAPFFFQKSRNKAN